MSVTVHSISLIVHSVSIIIHSMVIVYFFKDTDFLINSTILPICTIKFTIYTICLVKLCSERFCSYYLAAVLGVIRAIKSIKWLIGITP